MSRPSGLAVVLGATGGIGAEVVRELVARGGQVRTVTVPYPPTSRR